MLRIGLLVKKIGCTSIFDDASSAYRAVTLLHLEESCVLSIRKRLEGYSIQVGFGQVLQLRKLNKPQIVMFKKLDIPCKRKIVEFRVGNQYASSLKVAQEIRIDHFKVGQYIDVTGNSIGKGFSGVMKRHNFSGLSASHGVSVSHRSHGSTGQCQDPGKVLKGKKMAGHLGDAKVTTHNLKVIDVDVDKSLIAVCGSVPGAKNGFVVLRDAIKKPFLEGGCDC